MKSIFHFTIFWLLFFSFHTFSKQTSHSPTCTKEAYIEGAIGPATLEFLKYIIYKAKKDSCSSILLSINTPGGMLITTRKMVEMILESDIPFLCLVAPSGGHAGSAGAILLQSCHLNGGLEATHLGAATPIQGSGGDIKGDLRNKAINDTTSWVESLAELRGRNKKFAKQIVTEAKSVSSKEAHRLKAIDFYGKTKEEFIKWSNKKRVQIQSKKNQLVQTGQLELVNPGLRQQWIQFITDPEIIYLLYAGALLLIYFEITNPGIGVPLIVGSASLITAFVGMHKMDFTWGGALFMLMGLIFFILEAFVSGFGLFAISGVVFFVLGSIFLFDPTRTGGVDIPYPTIIVVSTLFSLMAFGLTYMVYSSFKKENLPPNRGPSGLIGEKGQVTDMLSQNEGWAEIQGERWKLISKDPLKKGDWIQVRSCTNMQIEVDKIKQDT